MYSSLRDLGRCTYIEPTLNSASPHYYRTIKCFFLNFQQKSSRKRPSFRSPMAGCGSQDVTSGIRHVYPQVMNEGYAPGKRLPAHHEYTQRWPSLTGEVEKLPPGAFTKLYKHYVTRLQYNTSART
jgi:hypothetical protein